MRTISILCAFITYRCTICEPQIIQKIAKGNENFQNLRNCLDSVTKTLFKPEEAIVYINLNDFEWIPAFSRQQINIRDFDFYYFQKYPYVNYVIYVNDFSEFFFELSTITDSDLWHRELSPRGKFLVIVDRESYIEEVVHYFWQEDVYNVIVLFLDENFANSTFLSANPYKAQLTYDVLGTCGDHDDVSYPNYSPKAENISLTFCCYEYDLPYMGIVNSTSPGTYINTLMLITEKMGINLNIKVDDENLYNNEFLTTGATPKLRRLIDTKQIDLFYIRNYYLHYFKEYEVTNYFIYDPSVWIIAKPGRVPNTEVILEIFTLECWCLIMSLLVITAIVVWAIGTFEHQQDYAKLPQTFLHIFATTLTKAIPLNLTSFKLKLVLLSYFLYTFVIHTYFFAVFSTVLTKPKYERVMTLEELVESNEVATVVKAFRISQLAETKIPLAVKLAAKSVEYYSLKIPHNRAHFVADNRNSVISTYESIFNWYNSEAATILGNRFLEARTDSFALRKGHPLYREMNRIISTIFECGFQAHWLGISMERKNGGKRSFVDVVPLSMNNMLGAYCVLGIGSILGFVALFCEVLVAEFSLRKRFIAEHQ